MQWQQAAIWWQLLFSRQRYCLWSALVVITHTHTRTINQALSTGCQQYLRLCTQIVFAPCVCYLCLCVVSVRMTEGPVSLIIFTTYFKLRLPSPPFLIKEEDNPVARVHWISTHAGSYPCTRTWHAHLGGSGGDRLSCSWCESSTRNAWTRIKTKREALEELVKLLQEQWGAMEGGGICWW